MPCHEWDDAGNPVKRDWPHPRVARIRQESAKAATATFPWQRRRQQGAAPTKGNNQMNIVPTRFEEQINRVDRTRSLVIGISSAATAFFCLYRVLWTIYAATVLSSVGFSPVSLIFPLVLWGVIGVAAGVAAVAFLRRYAKQP
jgi:hypothetical protein